MCFSVSIVRFGWAGGPQRQFGSFRDWVCRCYSQNSSTCVVCPPTLPKQTATAKKQQKPFGSISVVVMQIPFIHVLLLLCYEIWCEIYCSGAMSGLHQSNMECFFLCNGDETPEIVKPTGAHDFCFSEVHRNVLHRETRNI